MTSSPQALKVFFDEAAYYFGGNNDGLKEDLRKIEGVPNVTYLVDNGQVFVFDKLVQLVDEHRKRQSDLPLADMARSLIAEATVSANEAVETWGVVPEPYEMVESPTGGLRIRHRPFNALLPESYLTKAAVQNAFANILLSSVQSGNGDFHYRGQPMTLCDPLDTALLPPRPVIQRVEESENLGYAALRSVAYEPGFEPVSEALFDDVKQREVAWKNDSTRAARYAQDHAASIWARAATLRLETLDDPTDEVPEYGQEDFAELRPLYPELPMLSDGALYAWFDVYQMECCYINGWTANRDDDFLFYLLGKVAGRQHEQDTAKDVGQWIAHALLRGDALDAALTFGRAAALYDCAISRLARRVADAIRFLAENKNTTDQRGLAISTMMDMFRISRKFNCVPAITEQIW
ncbi:MULTISPECIES: hypothetical protein [Acidithiobacillus]|uniref:Uncharacterized protein n=2 Tax=Acidithiobacillus TaxID=119977 RepID=A0A179BMT2_ACIFR|nr:MULTISPECIES: hypothetical protein [Acidithiobacillus]MEB8476675.1 hypothetical protein [Acidithiobacillus ferriphilus]MEB8486001.1 hypothetical protein [Acidithiobacillus ferriphilus]MEB8489594.1 hypothetical protein [Acidithiobacillus ferriphilus]MEB8492479.1 hypothetical protein [Acidithiobacillus ferriphilus]MEB8515419.1 hypothetical protein [Acidithiobacillus ferriphilus]